MGSGDGVEASGPLDLKRTLSGPVALCVDRPILSLDRPFTYELPEELDAGLGSLVSVRFHGKLIRGWVLGPTDEIPKRMLKVQKLVAPIRFFDEPMLELLRWVADRYVAPLATVIARSHPPRVASEEKEALRPAASAIAAPRSGPPTALESYRNGPGVLQAIGKGSGGTYRLRPAPEQEQQVVVDAVESCLSAGRRAILIVPEADPVPATALAVADAFGERVGLFLGGDKRERYRTWLEIHGGRYDVVVGTRPAVFAPLRDVGLIWLARESHANHREDRSPSYHVRDVALARGQLQGAVFVMSALCHSAEAHVVEAVEVTPASRAWPPVEVVRPGPEGRAHRLVALLKGSRRAFLFEPLPGYGMARVCRSCLEPAACASCGGVLRLAAGRVACTVCEADGRCAKCGATDFGIARGGAERVEEWLRGVVKAPVRRVHPDGPFDPPAAREIIVGGPEAVKDLGPLDLDLVGILDADLAARRPGLASMEHALAIWMEAAGWARPNGRVVVQTRRPADPAIQALVGGNPARYYRAELDRRARAGFPAGYPVFRIVGAPELPERLEETKPFHLLASSLQDQTVCLATVRPDSLEVFGRTVRRLAEQGTVSRVEAEPHL